MAEFEFERRAHRSASRAHIAPASGRLLSASSCAACPIYAQHRTFPEPVGTSQLGHNRKSLDASEVWSSTLPRRPTTAGSAPIPVLRALNPERGGSTRSRSSKLGE